MRNVGSLALFCAIILLNLTLIGCGKSPYNTSSIPTPDGLNVTTTTDYPAVVMVILPGGTGLCSGTFISENAVLTAAHCALTDGEYEVITGWGTFTTTTHVNYGPGQVNDPNDMALLVFSQSVASRAQNQVMDLDDNISVGDTVRLVGFGCTNITTKSGAGVKRTGTNEVNTLDDYIDLVTPNSNGAYGILGPDNVAGSCFGDSGGPMLKSEGSVLKIVGITHAGGTYQSDIISEYVNLATRSDNRAWLSTENQTYSLNLAGF